ncbi:MAG: hypothetical protein FRX49_09334 [Trebouxia sp. A1-2]|nr:MAG: hypothetical protein FRX49_09334 [Trebouxia sp. A1-2]
MSLHLLAGKSARDCTGGKADDTIRRLLEVLQLVPKPDAVLSTPAVSPVQHHGQQFVLGQAQDSSHACGDQSVPGEEDTRTEKAGIAYGFHVKLQMAHADRAEVSVTACAHKADVLAEAKCLDLS